MAIQCFGISMINSSQSMAVDGELKDRGTVSPMRSGIMGMFQALCNFGMIHPVTWPNGQWSGLRIEWSEFEPWPGSLCCVLGLVKRPYFFISSCQECRLLMVSVLGYGSRKMRRY